MGLSPLGMIIANKVHKYLVSGSNPKKLVMYTSALLVEVSPSHCPSKLREAIRGILNGLSTQRDPSTNKVLWVEHTTGTNRGYNCSQSHADCVEAFGSRVSVMETVMFVANWGDE